MQMMEEAPVIFPLTFVEKQPAWLYDADAFLPNPSARSMA